MHHYLFSTTDLLKIRIKRTLFVLQIAVYTDEISTKYWFLAKVTQFFLATPLIRFTYTY